ncbi:transposase [Streptomyces bluensis]
MGSVHWEADGIFDQLTGLLRGKVRQAEGRISEPSACLIDSQSVKTSATVPLNSQGIDPAKKIIGRKRHIVTDTLGLLLAVAVTAASVHDSAAGTHLTPTSPHATPPPANLDRQRLQDPSRRTRSPPRHRPRNRPTRPQHTRLPCPAPPLGHEPKSTC